MVLGELSKEDKPSTLWLFLVTSIPKNFKKTPKSNQILTLGTIGSCVLTSWITTKEKFKIRSKVLISFLFPCFLYNQRVQKELTRVRKMEAAKLCRKKRKKSNTPKLNSSYFPIFSQLPNDPLTHVTNQYKDKVILTTNQLQLMVVIIYTKSLNKYYPFRTPCSES